MKKNEYKFLKKLIRKGFFDTPFPTFPHFFDTPFPTFPQGEGAMGHFPSGGNQKGGINCQELFSRPQSFRKGRKVKSCALILCELCFSFKFFITLFYATKAQRHQGSPSCSYTVRDFMSWCLGDLVASLQL